MGPYRRTSGGKSAKVSSTWQMMRPTHSALSVLVEHPGVEIATCRMQALTQSSQPAGVTVLLDGVAHNASAYSPLSVPTNSVPLMARAFTTATEDARSGPNCRGQCRPRPCRHRRLD